MVLDNQWSRCGEVLLSGVGIILPPQLLARVRIEGHKPIVRRRDEYGALPYPYAALPYQVSAVICPVIVPQRRSGTRIQRPHVIGNRNVQHSIRKQWRAFDNRSGRAALRTNVANPVYPSRLEPIQVGRIDLRERTVALPRVVPVECRPAFNRSTS